MSIREEIQKGYVDCIYWLEDDDKEEGLSDAQLSECALRVIQKDICQFMELCDNRQIDVTTLPFGLEQVGHDLWLTRNGHGTGFWDRGLGTLGDELLEVCNSLGTQEVYLSDHGEMEIF